MTATHICATCIPLLAHNRTAPSCTETPCKNCALREVDCNPVPPSLRFELGGLLFNHSRWHDAIENGDKVSAMKAKVSLKTEVMDFCDLMNDAPDAVTTQALTPISDAVVTSIKPAIATLKTATTKSAAPPTARKSIELKPTAATPVKKEPKAKATPAKKDKAQDAVKTGAVIKPKRAYTRKPKEAKQSTSEKKILPKPAIAAQSQQLSPNSELVELATNLNAPVNASNNGSSYNFTPIVDTFANTLPTTFSNSNATTASALDIFSPHPPSHSTLNPSAFDFNSSPQEWHNILSSDFSSDLLQDYSTSSAAYSSPSSPHTHLPQHHLHPNTHAAGSLLSSPFAPHLYITPATGVAMNEASASGGLQLGNEIGKRMLEQLQTLNATMSGMHEMMRVQMGLGRRGA